MEIGKRIDFPFVFIAENVITTRELDMLPRLRVGFYAIVDLHWNVLVRFLELFWQHVLLRSDLPRSRLHHDVVVGKLQNIAQRIPRYQRLRFLLQKFLEIQ